jgi:hypothetical protein
MITGEELVNMANNIGSQSRSGIWNAFRTKNLRPANRADINRTLRNLVYVS